MHPSARQRSNAKEVRVAGVCLRQGGKNCNGRPRKSNRRIEAGPILDNSFLYCFRSYCFLQSFKYIVPGLILTTVASLDPPSVEPFGSATWRSFSAGYMLHESFRIDRAQKALLPYVSDREGDNDGNNDGKNLTRVHGSSIAVRLSLSFSSFAGTFGDG